MPRLSVPAIQNSWSGWGLFWALIGCTSCLSDPPNSKVEGPPARVSVCDLFDEFDAFRGKVVMVRGVYFGDLRETCPRKFVIGGLEFSHSINLAYANPGDERVSFTTDSVSWTEL